MTVEKLFNSVKHLKHNEYTNDDLCLWLNEIEGRIQTEVYLKPLSELVVYDGVSDAEKELLVPFPYDSIYRWYLFAMLDFANAEYDKYQNELVMFNSAYSAFKKWYCETYNTAEE